MNDEQKRRAVFLDRDGVLNRNLWYADTGAWESPRSPAEFVLVDGVLPALVLLRDAGFLLFLVSNQPNEAKGKSAAGALEAMHAQLVAALAGAGLALLDAFYCTHHPDHTGPCVCRKPSPHFLKEAARDHGLALQQCWMVGDRVTDMQCGRAAGTRTAWVNTGQEPDTPDASLMDASGLNLASVVEHILSALSQGR